MYLIPKGSRRTPLFEEGGHVQAISPRLCGQERVLVLSHVQNLEKVELVYFLLEVETCVQTRFLSYWLLLD
jgi:hypothetical protein